MVQQACGHASPPIVEMLGSFSLMGSYVHLFFKEKYPSAGRTGITLALLLGNYLGPDGPKVGIYHGPRQK